MNTDWYEDVLDFHRTMGSPIGEKPHIPPRDIKKLRTDLIGEEVGEALDALWSGDLEKLADGLADSIVVLLGTAIACGIDLRPIWDEVHKTNMAKEGGPKAENGKQLKPEGWQPPKIKELLEKQKDARVHTHIRG